MLKRVVYIIFFQLLILVGFCKVLFERDFSQSISDDQGQAAAVLYENAGDGYGYLQDDYCLTTFIAAKSGDSVIVTCTQQGDLAWSQRRVSEKVIEDEIICIGERDVCSVGSVTATGLPNSGDLTSNGEVDMDEMVELGNGWQSGYDFNTLLNLAQDWLSGKVF